MSGITSFGIGQRISTVEGLAIGGSKFFVTPVGGLAVPIKNLSGGDLTEGYILGVDASNDDCAVHAPISSEMPIGIVWKTIPTGSIGWMVVAGYADVYIETATTTRGYWVGTSKTTAGRGLCAASTPAIGEHIREVGHAMRSAGAPGLVRCTIHFL